MIRGIERRKIFRSNTDRDDFIERLSIILPESNTYCYAWALLGNHAHFLFRSGKAGISKVMRRLLTGYAVTFNHKYKRHGQLFQNRYKSIICQEDTYFRELVRYIHLNPLRAKLVSDISELNRYPYCGHSALMGKKSRSWQDTRYVLANFGKTAKKARNEYIAFVKAGVSQGRKPELVGGGLIRSLGGWKEVKKLRLNKQDRIKGDERILGDSDFVMEVLEQADERYDRRYRLKSLGYDISRVERKVIELFDIEKENLYSGSRKKPISEARSLFCYWCVRELGESMTSMAKLLGLTQPAIGYSVDRGELIAKKEKYDMLG
ncbi:MAG: transposase [Candidatus Marinimicrobia bacterium]|nr:transposase [Candidatus Neomarinimicrobiota bacterium]